MLLWGKRIGTDAQQTISTPVWYARRTIFAELNGNRFDLKDASTQFEKDDSLLVIPLDENHKIIGDPDQWATAKITKIFGDDSDLSYFEYEVEPEDGASLPNGEVLLILNVKHVFESDSDFEYVDGSTPFRWAFVPMPYELVADEDTKYELYARGFRHPGWYRWAGYKEPHPQIEGEFIIRHRAELLVSMRSLRLIDAISNANNFSDKLISFDPDMASDETDVFGSGIADIIEPTVDTGEKIRNLTEVAQNSTIIVPSTNGGLAGNSKSPADIILS